MADISLVRVEAVLHDKFYEDVTLCWFCCGVIRDKQKTTDIVKELTEKYPLIDFAHLKRIKNVNEELHVLIKELPVHQSGEELDVLRKNLPKKQIKELYTTQVPKIKPLTRQQFTKAQKYWSCNFHEDKHIEKCLSGQLFSHDEIEKHRKYIQLTFEDEIKKTNAVGAVMVDPLTETVLAKAWTSTNHHLQHAVMKCIDIVSASQGGGAWNKENASQLQSCQRAKQCDSIVHQQGQQLPIDISNNDELPAKKCQKTESYLCTKYDLYTTVEPCIMCSMALVHSRIGRVFYVSEDSLAGGLGSVYKIHCHPCINHHFQVFKLVIGNIH